MAHWLILSWKYTQTHTHTHTHTHTYSTCDLYVGGMRSTGRLLQGHLSLQYSCEVGGGVLVSPTWTVLDGFGARPGLESSPQTMSSSIRKWLTRWLTVEGTTVNQQSKTWPSEVLLGQERFQSQSFEFCHVRRSWWVKAEVFCFVEFRRLNEFFWVNLELTLQLRHTAQLQQPSVPDLLLLRLLLRTASSQWHGDIAPTAKIEWRQRLTAASPPPPSSLPKS